MIDTNGSDPETVETLEVGAGHDAEYQAVGVGKRYGATVALDDVHFDLRPGEVHALVGENGAGKTTLVKILTGAESPGTGRLLVGGTVHVFRSPRDARRAGIAVVHQDNQLFDHLRVWENIAAGSSRTLLRGPFIDRSAMRRRVREVLGAFDLEIDPNARVAGLAATERKLVEIARGLIEEPRFLLLDEPTAALDPTEVIRLASIITGLARRGMGVVHVSHHLEEVLSLADRITVLRDGRRVETFERQEIDEDRLIEAMVGSLVDEREPTDGRPAGRTVVELRQLRLLPSAPRLDLDIRAGQITAAVGLVGSGGAALLAGLGGALGAIDGEVVVDGRLARLRTPAAAVARGIGYLSSNRKRDGIIADQSLAVNVALASLPQHTRAGFLDRRGVSDVAEAARERFGIRCGTVRQPMGTLSGGNQQKSLIGRWLSSGVPILVIDEPTHGVDVAARAEIHGHLRAFADDGGTLVIGSSDLDEVVALADRVLVLRKGHLVADLDRHAEDLDRHRLLSLVTGLSGPLAEEVSA